MDSQLSKSDIAAAVELVLEVTQRPPGLKSRGRRLLQKLSESLGNAHGCLFVLPTSLANGAPNSPLIHTTDPSEQGHNRAAAAMHIIRNRLHTQSQHPGPQASALTGPAASAAAPLPAQAATWRQPVEEGQMDSADGSSPPDGELLCAIRPLSSSRFTCLALHRPAARGGFTDRDLAFVELVHDTCPLVASPKLAAKNAPNLPRRCIEVLHLLCDGHSEKEISTNLEIGMGTVHTYVKTLYRHFDVKTRSELLSLWIRKKRADRKYVSKLAFGRSTLSSRIRGDSPV